MRYLVNAQSGELERRTNSYINHVSSGVRYNHLPFLSIGFHPLHFDLLQLLYTFHHKHHFKAFWNYVG